MKKSVIPAEVLVSDEACHKFLNAPGMFMTDSYGCTLHTIEAVDRALAAFGLEIELVDNGSSDYIGRIIKRC